MELIVNNVANLSALGLFWDGLGIFVLGVTSVFKAKREIELEAGTYWGFNPHELRNKISTRMDITVGSTLLLVGFVFQFLSSLSVQLNNLLCGIFWVLPIIITLAYYIGIKNFIVEDWAEKLGEKLRVDDEGTS